MTIGVLAIQGDFSEHIAMLQRLEVDAIKVRLPKELDGLDGLILPGGESTTLGIIATRYGLLDAIQDKAVRGLPIFGTCAGAILLAKTILESDQPRLAILDIVINRNAYGRQRDSFEANLTSKLFKDKPLMGIFIRAPIIESVGSEVDVLAELDGKPVLVQQGNLLAATFHPELTDDTRVHQHFLSLCK